MKMQKRKKHIWPWIVGAVAVIAIVNAVRTGGDGDIDEAPIEIIVDRESTFSPKFMDTANKYFNATIIESAATPQEGEGVITLKNNTEYFGTGDKINKVMAIESARLFREVKELNDLRVTLPNDGKTYQMHVTREQMDDHYGMQLADLTIDNWRSDFLERYDTKEARAAFVAKYVKVQ